MHLRPSDAELGLLMSMDASQVLLHLILLLLLSLPFTSTCHLRRGAAFYTSTSCEANGPYETIYEDYISDALSDQGPGGSLQYDSVQFTAVMRSDG